MRDILVESITQEGRRLIRIVYEEQQLLATTTKTTAAIEKIYFNTKSDFLKRSQSLLIISKQIHRNYLQLSLCE